MRSVPQTSEFLVRLGARPIAMREELAVLEVRGGGGGPPYVVRWDPDGHTGVFHPAAGTCAVVPEPANG